MNSEEKLREPNAHACAHLTERETKHLMYIVRVSSECEQCVRTIKSEQKLWISTRSSHDDEAYFCFPDFMTSVRMIIFCHNFIKTLCAHENISNPRTERKNALTYAWPHNENHKIHSDRNQTLKKHSHLKSSTYAHWRSHRSEIQGIRSLPFS